jgi:transcription-repair coupling factor (superfamily II helicase)|nr:transcription-repair coupling factor [Kofleriaceae bacterium]
MWPPLATALTGDARVIASGATPAWAAWLAVELSARELVVVVCPDDDAARDAARDLRFWLGPAADGVDDLAMLPGLDVSPYAELSPDRDCLVERVATLYRLATPHLAPRLVVTSAHALARTTLPAGELASRGLTLRVGERVDRDQLAAQLVAAGWTRTPVVDEPGTFAVRGEVVDIYAPLAPHPVRIELFGDDIEALRWFDAESQRTLRAIDVVHLPPVRETIPTGSGDVRSRLRAYAEEIAHPTKATRRLIEQLESGDPFVGIEAVTPAFHDAMVAPATYVPASARWIVVDPAACRRAHADLRADAERRFDEARANQKLAFPVDSYVTPELELGARRLELPVLEVHDHGDATKLRVEVDDLRVLKQQLEHARTFNGDNHAEPLIAAIADWRDRGMRVVIAADAQARGDRLHGVLEARGFAVRAAAPGERPGDHPGAAVTILNGAPSASFASPHDGYALITTSDVFGKRVHHPTASRKRAKDALLGNVHDFGALRAGDYLVHQKHGVGRYQGLVRLDVAGAAQLDSLKLDYDGGSLYLPVYRLGEVQRYVGAEGHAPRLDKLGGITWEATRTKVSRSIRALAEELLQLYAQRAAVPGHRFPPADDTFRELEATFRFDETPDQASAIDSVLADMEAPRAMDRLVCGDVGYGKTEVALRAIFRCVQGGKQAAVLAPTTVLVEQHARTMTERYAPFGVQVGKLSRFQSRAEQLEVITKLAAGQLDVVVGTHRLLSADVRFKDLGLLVIDEEQRFGVAHKEKIKKTRAYVDVLTLTATPIPRTLHLAMAGMRDLSIIATPPADRRAVRTLVSRVDDQVIRGAIEAELARAGQLFFITPTIGTMPVQEPDPRLPNDARPQAPRRWKPREDDRTIDEWADYIRGLVPAARVGVGHGSLPAEQLEKVMVDFVSGNLDVLVATTIVESGLDIPRANTMFVARADAFGLAQLYQLRGRIGRSSERAYCYLLVPEPEHLTDEARRRLEALQRFTELGAGFQIASQDLEIRGGGELLGNKQSGSIAAVGFDQYVKMLERAVAELDGKPVHQAIDPELTVDTPGFIPDDYVPDPGQRLELYKRLSEIDTDDERTEVMTEIQDRYGPLPADVLLLGELMGVKAVARRLGAIALELGASRVAIAVPDDTGRNAVAAGWKRLPDGRYATSPYAPRDLKAGPLSAAAALERTASARRALLAIAVPA